MHGTSMESARRDLSIDVRMVRVLQTIFRSAAFLFTQTISTAVPVVVTRPYSCVRRTVLVFLCIRFSQVTRLVSIKNRLHARRSTLKEIRRLSSHAYSCTAVLTAVRVTCTLYWIQNVWVEEQEKNSWCWPFLSEPDL